MDQVGLFEPTTSGLYRLSKRAADEGDFNCSNMLFMLSSLNASSSAHAPSGEVLGKLDKIVSMIFLKRIASIQESGDFFLLLI
jgi:hypothetical protein